MTFPLPTGLLGLPPGPAAGSSLDLAWAVAVVALAAVTALLARARRQAPPNTRATPPDGRQDLRAAA